MAVGKYIVIEGPPGVGKSTQLRELADKLAATGVPFRVLSELNGGETITARAMQQLVNNADYPMTTEAEVLLYSAVRAEVLTGVKQSLSQGITCIVDGNYLTTLTLQYYGNGDVPDYQAINAVIAFAAGDTQPDMTIVMDATASSLKERANASDDVTDEAFLERLRAGYLWEAKQRGLTVVFATDAIPVVAEEIWQLVKAELGDQISETRAGSPTSIKQIIDEKRLPAPHEPPLKLAIDETASAAQVTHSHNEMVSTLAFATLRPSAHRELTNYTDHLQKSAKGRYHYYQPKDLDASVQETYTATMDSLFQNYANLTRQLTDYLRLTSDTPKTQKTEDQERALLLQATEVTRLVLPLAATIPCPLALSGATLVEQILVALSDSMPEVRDVASRWLTKAREVAPSALQSLAQPELARQVTAYHAGAAKQLASLAQEYASDTYASSIDQPVTLVDYWPRNELNLVADMLYEQSTQPLRELQLTTANWSYEQKQNIYAAYLGERSTHLQLPGTALEKAHYSWDIVSDFDTFRHFSGQAGLEDVVWQSVTPRYGYDVPSLIEEANLVEEYEACFDLSLQLYSLLQGNNYFVEAQYATLLGHKLHWKVTYNARQAYRLYERPQPHTGCQILVRQLAQKAGEIHPIIADSYITPTSA